MFLGLLSIAFGISILFSKRKDAEALIRWQNDNFNTKFGKKEIELDAKLNLLGGVIFIVLGVLVVFGIIDLRQ